MYIYLDPLLRSLMLLIIFEISLHLDWRAPVINRIDWTWFGKKHTCLHKVSQLTIHIRAKTKPSGWRNCLQGSETGWCQEKALWKAKLRLGEEGLDNQEPSGQSGWAPQILSGELSEGQPSLQHSTDLGIMAEWPDGSLFSVKDTWKRAWSLPKSTQRALVWSDET